MNSNIRLVFASVFFAVAWTLWMIWWTGYDQANVVILGIIGIIAGVCWYFGMRAFARWQAGRKP